VSGGRTVWTVQVGLEKIRLIVETEDVGIVATIEEAAERAGLELTRLREEEA
jgi:hypothetical protein